MDITKAFPLMHKKHPILEPKPPIPPVQKSPKIPKKKYWKGRGSGRGGVGSAGGGNRQVRQLSHQNKKRPPFRNQNRGGQQACKNVR